MRTFLSQRSQQVRALCISAACDLEPDVVEAIKAARPEGLPLGQEILGQIITNFEIAGKRACRCVRIPAYRFFVEIGRDVSLDGSLEEAINEACAAATRTAT